MIHAHFESAQLRGQLVGLPRCIFLHHSRLNMSTFSLSDALKMLADCFEADPSALSAKTQRDQIPGWDSMGALALMAELDERFDIELTADESRRMRGVGDVLSFLRERGALVH